jgi:hypothetical protein
MQRGFLVGESLRSTLALEGAYSRSRLLAGHRQVFGLAGVQLSLFPNRRGFPVRLNQCRRCGFRSCTPLRGSSGFHRIPCCHGRRNRAAVPAPYQYIRGRGPPAFGPGTAACPSVSSNAIFPHGDTAGRR